MIKISNLITERQQYAIGAKTTPWKDELLAHIVEEAHQDNIAFISIGSTILAKKKIDALQKRYHIVGVYKIGEIFTNTSIPFYIIHLSKKPSSELNIALFNGKCYDTKAVKNKETRFCVPEFYTKEWNIYINLLEGWINGDNTPSNNKDYEFKTISKDSLFHGSLFPETYSEENIELRRLIEKQDTRVLSEMAEILTPKPDIENKNKVKVLSIRDLKYPLNVDNIEFGTSTNIILQKGDVIIPNVKTRINSYLFNYDGHEPIYASQHLLVIRCKDILPEYLYLYLTNEISLKAINARYVGVAIQRLTAKTIEDLPIAVPTQDEKKYITDFQTLTSFGIRNYDQLQELNEYYDRLVKIQQETEKPQAIEDILNIELANNIKAYREDQLRSFLSDDLKELNICFREKAYKAALILAGSILEAVLIDWLSEIHHKNYFEEEYLVTDKNGKTKEADLYSYINEIKYIRRPSWANEARKAHAIRKKRNLVHAKLCINSDEINEKVCREVISYLSDVLKTRGVNVKI